MYGSELPPLPTQRSYIEMTPEELNQEIANIQGQLQDPNLTPSNSLVLQEQLMYASRQFEANQNAQYGQLHGIVMPVLAGYVLTRYLVKNPEVRNKNLAYAGGVGLAYFLHHLISK
jgi:hypothetical protein